MPNSIPFHVNALNTLASSALGGQGLSSMVSAFIGSTQGKKYTYGLYSLLPNLVCWKFIHPYLIQPLFMHAASNTASKIIGALFTGGLTATISYLFHHYIVSRYCTEKTPLLGQIIKENQHSRDGSRSLSLPESVLISLIPSLFIMLPRGIEKLAIGVLAGFIQKTKEHTY